jgi:S-DNA-T family DNA segregation ATPase FtsK/SpoIIIE
VLKRVAHDYGSGADENTLARAMACLRYVYGELERRAAVLSQIAEERPDLVPENKVTPQLAGRRELGLHPMVLAIDECQELYAHPDYKAEAKRMSEGITKRGPAMGVIKLDATQRPDADSIPTGISANAVLRFCLKVMGFRENDMVLGQSMHQNGVKATMLSRNDKGIGYLAGEADEPQVIRTYYIDNPTAERIAERARVAREKLGLLTGLAAGQAPEREAIDVLQDVQRVMGKMEKVRTEDLLAKLGELRPQVYGSWNDKALAAALKPHAIEPGQVWVDGANRQGYKRAEVLEALTRRELVAA